MTLDWSLLADFFDKWQPGCPPPGLSKLDDEFFISRQRPLCRIPDNGVQPAPGVPHERKLFMWTPLDDPTMQWKALPRYCFEGDNFSMWQYIDSHGNWSAPWLRVAAGISDAAAKNGVSVGCVLSIPWNAGVCLDDSTSYSRTLRKLTERNADGSFRNTMKLARLMKFYGINALGVNSEFHTDSATIRLLRDFFIDLHRKAQTAGWRFELQWYDITDDSGALTLDGGLDRHNRRMFGSTDSIVSDRLFANYNWTPPLLASSQRHAETLGRSPYDYYAGFDIQGRAFRNDYWRALANSHISVGLWGAHSQNLLHQSATDDGTSDTAIQRAYLLKQEMVFSGGNRNPALLPDFRNDCSLANADLSSFHGMARLVTAKSTISAIPFVTRFCLGNGLKLFKDGKVVSPMKWYNIGMQDWLPTWRFWITDRNDSVSADTQKSLARAELTWDDAFCGGSCLRIHGATDFSRIRLFRTSIVANHRDELSVVYKTGRGRDTHARLFVAVNGDKSSFKEIAIPPCRAEGEWTAFKARLGKLGITDGDTVTTIGMTVENTDGEYRLMVGELALRNPQQRFATVKPIVKEIRVMRGWHDRVDFKMRYASREEHGDEKTYNDEVGTWYYEIFFQQKGRKPMLLTCTESWAAYVVGAPLEKGLGRVCRFGVRAVAPDGKHRTPVAWSRWTNVEYNAHDSKIVVSSDVAEPGKAVSVGYADDMMPAARRWTVAEARSGKAVAEADNARSLQTSIGEAGVYDVFVTDSDGKEHVARGLVKIARRNGKPSHACRISDPDMLSIPADAIGGREFTIAMWVKADRWAHDKMGTNLISKNSIADSWPYNNWGDLWVQVRPEWTDKATGRKHPADEVSFNTMGCEDMEGPTDMVSDGYSIPSGVWTHIAVTQDAEKRQKIYVNGRLVAGPTLVASATCREEQAAANRRINAAVPANIYIGGGGVYKAALSGAVDDVQIWNRALTDEDVARAMRGYADRDVPEGLSVYYTFEEIDCDGLYPNHGRAEGCSACMVRMVKSGGENTATAEYARQKARNDAEGCPMLTEQQ